MRNTITIDEYQSRIGQEIGVSDWVLVDQARIDEFADVTEDWQAIHVDPERARQAGFRGTIAHGFLTTSLLAAMLPSALPRMAGVTTGFNYGLNNLRFLAPVHSGKCIRARFILNDCSERSPGEWRFVFDVSVEIENEVKPALVAQWLVLYRID
jgi:acyl dehydratase